MSVTSTFLTYLLFNTSHHHMALAPFLLYFITRTPYFAADPIFAPPSLYGFEFHSLKAQTPRCSGLSKFRMENAEPDEIIFRYDSVTYTEMLELRHIALNVVKKTVRIKGMQEKAAIHYITNKDCDRSLISEE
jgi:hypothetical protein